MSLSDRSVPVGLSRRWLLGVLPAVVWLAVSGGVASAGDPPMECTDRLIADPIGCRDPTDPPAIPTAPPPPSVPVLPELPDPMPAADGNGVSSEPSISADGRYVAFRSGASNMLEGDTNGADDIFLRDRTRATTSRVSLSSAGAQADGASTEPAISADGRYLAFGSAASNLVGGDTNGVADVLIHDRTTGETTRVSVDGGGAQANGLSYSPSVSADGRYVAFRSSASNLVGGDTNGADDVFVRDRSAGTTSRVSVGASAAQANAASGSPAIAGNGGFVAFQSSASNLVSGDTNSSTDVFVRSLATGTTTRVSVGSGGAQGSGASSAPSISADGSRIAFQSDAPFASGDANGASDIYVRDRSASTTEWATGWVAANQGLVGTGGASTSPSISGDGRYVALVLDSDVHLADLNNARDIYEYDLASDQWALVSHDDLHGPGNKASDSPSLSSDGVHTAFESLATNFHADTNAVQDSFVHTWVGDPVTGRLEGGQAAPADGPTEETAPRHCSLGKPATPSTQLPSSGDSAETPTNPTTPQRFFCRVTVASTPSGTAAGALLPGEVPAAAARAVAGTLGTIALVLAVERAEELSSPGTDRCWPILYHYTSKANAANIYQTGKMYPGAGSFVYATTISPFERTQSDLRAHLGITDVSAWVMLCQNKLKNLAFQPVPDAPPGYTDYWRAQGVPVEVEPAGWGLTPPPE